MKRETNAAQTVAPKVGDFRVRKPCGGLEFIFMGSLGEVFSWLQYEASADALWFDSEHNRAKEFELGCVTLKEVRLVAELVDGLEVA